MSLGDCVYTVGGTCKIEYRYEVSSLRDSILASVKCLNMTRRKWSSMQDLPQAAGYFTVATYDKKIFVFGGVDAAGKETCCSRVFDVTSGSWSTVSDMPESCTTGAAVTLNAFM